jgi:hypothetical protein
METIKVKARVGDDGILKLAVPARLSGHEVEVVLVLQPSSPQPLDSNGWPIGFFERTYGALADDPIERPPQPPLEIRESFE